MARCPLCSERSAKRFCPAKAIRICSVCCGSKREVEIDCPSACSYLHAGRTYEAEKRPLDPELIARVQPLGEEFLHKFSPVINALTLEVAAFRQSSPWLVDVDVIEVYRTLGQTLKTLDSGVYYDSRPEGPVRMGLYERLKSVVDEWMQPKPGGPGMLRVSDAMQVMDFLLFAATVNSNPRPKSRQYLDWIAEMTAAAGTPVEPEASRLILP